MKSNNYHTTEFVGVVDMTRKLRMKCPNCGRWNRVPVNKIFVKPDSPEPKVKVMIPMYKPLKTETCKKCKRIIARPEELIRIVKENVEVM